MRIPDEVRSALKDAQLPARTWARINKAFADTDSANAAEAKAIIAKANAEADRIIERAKTVVVGDYLRQVVSMSSAIKQLLGDASTEAKDLLQTVYNSAISIPETHSEVDSWWVKERYNQIVASIGGVPYLQDFLRLTGIKKTTFYRLYGRNKSTMVFKRNINKMAKDASNSQEEPCTSTKN